MDPQEASVRIFCAAITGAIVAGCDPLEAVEFARTVVREAHDNKPDRGGPNIAMPRDEQDGLLAAARHGPGHVID